MSISSPSLQSLRMLAPAPADCCQNTISTHSSLSSSSSLSPSPLNPQVSSLSSPMMNTASASLLNNTSSVDFYSPFSPIPMTDLSRPSSIGSLMSDLSRPVSLTERLTVHRIPSTTLFAASPSFIPPPSSSSPSLLIDEDDTDMKCEDNNSADEDDLPPLSHSALRLTKQSGFYIPNSYQPMRS